MRRIITGLSAVLAGVTFGSCTTKLPPCPADGQTFRVLALSSSLAPGDHANASFDGDQIVVTFAQGALGNETSSSIWSEPVSCAGEVGAPVMVSRSLGTNAQPAETLANDSTWIAWAASSTATTGDTSGSADGGVADAGSDTDGGSADAGVVTVVESPVHGSMLARGSIQPDATDFAIPVTRNGDAFENTAQAHQLIGGSEGNVALAGSRAISSDHCLVPFVQRFDPSLNPPLDGPSNLEPSDALGCLAGETAIGGSADEGFHFAWLQQATTAAPSDPRALLYASWLPGQANMTSSTTVASDLLSAPSASQGTEATNPPHYLTYALLGDATTAGFIKVFDMVHGPGSEMKVDLAATETLVGRPLIAGAENGGALAWTVTQQNGDRKMFVQRFTYVSGIVGATPSIVDLSVQASTTVGRIESITHLTGNSYFVTWTQTRSSNERNLLRGAFVIF